MKSIFFPKISRRYRLVGDFVVASSILLVSSLNLQATVVGVAGGTAAPAATLGPYTMTPFPADLRGEGASVSSVPSPLGGDVGFTPSTNHRTIPTGWATWSNGYTGDVYSDFSSTTMTLTMPGNTGAFYLYAEPVDFSPFNISAQSQDGTTVTQNVQGQSGADYYGFYGTAGNTIVSITVTSSAAFGIGEFGIAKVPEPCTLVLVGLGLSGLGVATLRKKYRRV